MTTIREPNEREYVHPDALVEEIRIAQEQAYFLAREQLKKAAERNKKNYDMRVRLKKCSVGTWVLYYSPAATWAGRPSASVITQSHF